MDVPPPPDSADTAAPRAAETADPVSATPAHGATNAPALSDEALIQQIEALYPGWGVWRSDARRWWAFRTASNPLTIDQLRAGCSLIVQADTETQLRAEILAEIELARRPLN